MLKEIENAIDKAADRVKLGAAVISSLVDKKPLESKKFWALLLSIFAIAVLLLLSGASMLHMNPDLAMHAMDKIVWIVGTYLGSQGVQDAVDAYKGK